MDHDHLPTSTSSTSSLPCDRRYPSRSVSAVAGSLICRRSVLVSRGRWTCTDQASSRRRSHLLEDSLGGCLVGCRLQPTRPTKHGPLDQHWASHKFAGPKLSIVVNTRPQRRLAGPTVLAPRQVRPRPDPPEPRPAQSVSVAALPCTTLRLARRSSAAVFPRNKSINRRDATDHTHLSPACVNIDRGGGPRCIIDCYRSL
jgi:hypothetical protein